MATVSPVRGIVSDLPWIFQAKRCDGRSRRPSGLTDFTTHEIKRSKAQGHFRTPGGLIALSGLAAHFGKSAQSAPGACRLFNNWALFPRVPEMNLAPCLAPDRAFSYFVRCTMR